MKVDTVENMKQSALHLVKEFFGKYFQEDAERLGAAFEKEYFSRVDRLGVDTLSEVDGLRNLIVNFKPALSAVLQPCEEYDLLLNMMLWSFKASWEGAHRRKRKPPTQKKGPVLPGSDPSIELVFHCTSCGHDIKVPYKQKVHILNSEAEIETPIHCGKPAKIRIIRKERESRKRDLIEELEPIEPIEMLMGYIPADSIEYMKVLSVGIDIGSSTSHLIFSRLTMKRERGFMNLTNRFNLVHREVIYESQIIFTPLIDRYNIDIDAVVEFCEAEYEKAGISPEMVETGAVLVTGETAKKKNAEEIVKRLSSESGRFVSAAAGPNLESLLSAMGSGVVAQSLRTGKTILHTDIGGGTSNMAIVSNGQVLSTSCINIGGRLLGIDKDNKIWRIDGPTQFVMQQLGMEYKIGEIIPIDDSRKIAKEYAKALVEVMQGPATSPIAMELMMTDGLEFLIPVDVYSFSGGVAELYFGKTEDFDDIGKILAEQIRILVEEQHLTILEPENKIRATVIGAGAFSLSVSGSTTFYDKGVELPVVNVPVVPVTWCGDFTPAKLIEGIGRAFNTFDLIEGEDLVALYFRDLIVSKHYTGDEWLLPFAKAIEEALANSVSSGKMIILIFRYDIAKRLGLIIRDETSIKNNILVIDELQLEAGDWIDIGAPLGSTDSFPVTVKSLVFNENKEYSDVD